MFESVLNSRFIRLFLATSMLLLSFQSTVQAALIGTPTLMNEQQLKVDRDKLLSSLQREEVKQALEAQGVDLKMAEKRVAAMTAEEVRSLNGKLAELPAGSGLVDTVVLILVILLVTDLLGLTNVYPFI